MCGVQRGVSRACVCPGMWVCMVSRCTCRHVQACACPCLCMCMCMYEHPPSVHLDLTLPGLLPDDVQGRRVAVSPELCGNHDPPRGKACPALTGTGRELGDGCHQLSGPQPVGDPAAQGSARHPTDLGGAQLTAEGGPCEWEPPAGSTREDGGARSWLWATFPGRSWPPC